MKHFLIKILAFFSIPLLLLGIIYLVVDPFRTLRPFGLDYFDVTNRDYLSTELFLYNYPSQHYNSYIFGSSRVCGINSYHWKHYLPEDANQYVFQSWSETLSGIEQKISYLDSHNIPINNALILLDIPGSFSTGQNPNEALTLKDYHFSGQPRLLFQLRLFYNFIQKPSIWIKSITSFISNDSPIIVFDSISNDWDKNNRYRDFRFPPERDSLSNCSTAARKAFLAQFSSNQILSESNPLINNELYAKLAHIAAIFKKHSTNYQIIVSPAPCYTNNAINHYDLNKLQMLFGPSYVHDYSGVNAYSIDYNNFSDPNHFGLYVGWNLIEEIYNLDSVTINRY